jgi:hypothetical protein
MASHKGEIFSPLWLFEIIEKKRGRITDNCLAFFSK